MACQESCAVRQQKRELGFDGNLRVRDKEGRSSNVIWRRLKLRRNDEGDLREKWCCGL